MKYRRMSPSGDLTRIENLSAWIERHIRECIVLMSLRAYWDGYEKIVITAVTFESSQRSVQFTVEAESA